ncbi:MAG: MBL fold metallo-hydrolase [Lachnospiraceae bacterium]|nr:MBL fold metallo-hydrolase [Lachnospiraceae bacterium]
MRLLSIASGSSGNCIYVGDEDTHLLVDAGISAKRIEAGLNENDIKTADVSGILITHEHSDHISGLGVLARRYGIPMYATMETIEEIKRVKTLGAIEQDLFVPIRADEDFQIDNLTVHPFSISHDAANPVAYRIENDKEQIAVATDMGTYDDYIIENLRGLDALLLEANHDVNMLETGSYPYPLKRRILSDRGHLSNELSGQLLTRILHDGLKHIFLGHLSKENNYAELAYETVKLKIAMSDTRYQGNEFPIQVARRDTPSQMVFI